MTSNHRMLNIKVVCLVEIDKWLWLTNECRNAISISMWNHSVPRPRRQESTTYAPRRLIRSAPMLPLNPESNVGDHLSTSDSFPSTMIGGGVVVVWAAVRRKKWEDRVCVGGRTTLNTRGGQTDEASTRATRVSFSIDATYPHPPTKPPLPTTMHTFVNGGSRLVRSESMAWRILVQTPERGFEVGSRCTLTWRMCGISRSFPRVVAEAYDFRCLGQPDPICWSVLEV